jgi:hypothetical protein
MSRIDVHRTLQIAAVDVAVGRIVGLHESPREGPECVAKPPLNGEHEIRFQISAQLLGVRSDVCGMQLGRPGAAGQFTKPCLVPPTRGSRPLPSGWI